ncbi:MAG: NAD(P)/FAD-dependent oxidoreductase [Anaerolineaceae bacterium]|nr:NAD(P)/FAD-dependent oxidoreductase [Anaerolineaceae bacterium]
MNKKVIIIGGGIAGLSAACLALQRGFHVELYEQNNNLGGDSHFTTIEGFSFDINPKFYPAPYLFDSLIRTNEKSSMLSELFSQAIPTAQVLFADEKMMRLVSDVEVSDLPESIATITPLTGDGAYHKLDGVLQEILDRFSGKRLPIWQQLSKNRKGNLQQMLLPMIGDFSSDPYFQQCLVAIAAISGIPVPNLQIRDLFMPALVRRSGLSLPTHGMKSVIDVLETYINNAKAKIFTSTQVDEILSQNNNVCGIRLADQSQQWADYVLNTSSSLAPEALQVHLAQPAMVLHLGISNKELLKDFQLQNILILNNNFRKWDTQSTISHRWLPDYIYLQQPTLINPSLAPQNCGLLSIRFSIPQITLDYREKEIIRNNLLSFLEQHYIPDLKQNIRMESIHMLSDQYTQDDRTRQPTIRSEMQTPAFLLQKNTHIAHLHQYYENRRPIVPIILFATQQWIETIADKS